MPDELPPRHASPDRMLEAQVLAFRRWLIARRQWAEKAGLDGEALAAMSRVGAPRFRERRR